ncbi:Zinc finger CCCH domain-containing protein 15 [Heterocephalus glaber]|uniref:Zinc finger CCCH domain-containing protein 15 n=1 Tax=Heterocephalus glaber TaxID=10181 RepID=G5BDP2_HETGA|nr:Zinc finger CCCH domain-containing protein 15 [Heterocephalus glaber]
MSTSLSVPCGCEGSPVFLLLLWCQSPSRHPSVLKSGQCHLSPQRPPRNRLRPGAAKRRSRKKKKEKIIEDKTFGTHQIKFGQQNPRQVAQSEAEKKLKKDDKKKELQELNELFKPVVAAQKQGQCTKGAKHKFSHDLTLERKCEKRSVYIDARDEELEKETMNNWNEKKLEEVVNKKHGPNVTKITLDSFLMWKKRKRQEKIDKLEQDMERRKADFKAGKAFVISGREVFEFRPELVNDDDEEADDTRYTQGTGADEKRKRQEKIDKLEQDMERRKADFKAGKAFVISGREVFEFRPELVNDDDEEADDTHYTQGTGADEVDDSVSVNDIDLSLYIPRDVDETGITVGSLERFSTYALDRDENKLSEASGGRAENGERSDLEEDNELDGRKTGAIGAVPVDENLFTGEDLDELEEELNTLDLEE